MIGEFPPVSVVHRRWERSRQTGRPFTTVGLIYPWGTNGPWFPSSITWGYSSGVLLGQRAWNQLFGFSCSVLGVSLVAQRLKHLPAMRETWVRSLGREDPLEKEMATHSSILAWRIPWTEEPNRNNWRAVQVLSTMNDSMDLSWQAGPGRGAELGPWSGSVGPVPLPGPAEARV